MMKQWTYLKPGDVVDVIAPSSYCSKAEIRSGLTYLKSLGLQVRYPAGLVKPDFVYANTVQKTLEYIRWAIYNKESKAIWSLRGGSGTFRLMTDLYKWKKPSHVKLFVGISDITLLHVFLNQKWNWPTLHGPMISMLGRSKAHTLEKKSLESVILGHKDEVEFGGLIPLNEKAKKSFSINAPMLGGNLCLVESSLGTPYEVSFRGAIAFLEDIDERGYALERTFYHLENSKALLGARAVVFGDFVGGNERDGSNLTHIALKRMASRLNIPVFKGLPSGHGVIVKSVPLNTPCRLTGGYRGKLICKTGGK
jgi:muramoyltetrapeptide carboxypeptidase